MEAITTDVTTTTEAVLPESAAVVTDADLVAQLQSLDAEKLSRLDAFLHSNGADFTALQDQYSADIAAVLAEFNDAISSAFEGVALGSLLVILRSS